MCVLTPVFCRGRAVRLLRLDRAQERHRRAGAGKLLRPGARDFNEGLHLPAVRYQRRPSARTATSSASSPPTAARPSWCWATSAASSALTASASGALQRAASPNTARTRSLACFARLFELSETAAARRGRRMEGRPLRGRALRRRRRHRPEQAGAHPRRRREEGRPASISISRGSADQTKGPANIRPPLVQAACAYCLISLIDPHIYRQQRPAATPSPSRRARAACSIRAFRRR